MSEKGGVERQTDTEQPSDDHQPSTVTVSAESSCRDQVVTPEFVDELAHRAYHSDRKYVFTRVIDVTESDDGSVDEAATRHVQITFEVPGSGTTFTKEYAVPPSPDVECGFARLLDVAGVGFSNFDDITSERVIESIS